MAHLDERRAASSKRLQEIKDVTPEIADKVRKAWKTVTNRHEARMAVDQLIETYGVEYLGRDRRTGLGVYYCNAGDTYSTTILFRGLTMSVGCWGDLVESRSIVESNHAY